MITRKRHDMPLPPPSQTSISQAYSCCTLSLLSLFFLKNKASVPFPLSTPSHLCPGGIPYLFGGNAPLYNGCPLTDCPTSFFLKNGAVGSFHLSFSFNSLFISSSS